MSDSPTTLIPTTVFSGFLGSGKTTIISHLIDELQANHKQVIYIKNEIGNETIDSQIMRGKDIQTKELLNGCICCTLVGPFITAINEIAASFHPDRIIIEASGAADPAAIALMIDAHPKLRRDGVITLIDVVNFAGYKDISQTARNQAIFTDLIVFNKVELVDLAQKQAVVGYVRELNAHAPIVEAPEGVLRSDIVFGTDPDELNHLLSEFSHEQTTAESTTHVHHAHADHLTKDGIDSLVVSFASAPSREQLQTYISNLPSAVFRVKGFVQLNTGTVVVVNKVGIRSEMTPLPADQAIPDHKKLLVLIGFHLHELVGQLEPKL